MRIKGIDFPEQLIRAQAAGDLVIFAGAGVSKPPPSKLPLFGELAQQIGEPSGLARERYANGGTEPEDRYLGRLKHRGVHVHETAARILVGPHTTPHDLHRLLLKIFASHHTARLVTTNFDTHFSTAAASVFDPQIETFFAPALPLGHEFSGLVYLHGCAEKDSKRCVLTDEDFGRAYLTHAWASRFLLAMFMNYTVLFVGYSHNDVVMNYLARGLPPVDGKRRFVFTADDNLSKWEFLGIHPISYKLVNGENPHLALTQSVECWVAELRSGLLDKALRIRAIAEAHPPLEGEDADYLRYALTQIDTARVFLKHARAPEWIGWLEKNRLIQPVFNPRVELGQFERELASWLAEHFLVKGAHDFWAAIHRNGGSLHPELCICVCRRLCRRVRDPLVADVFSRWVAVLLAQPRNVMPCAVWAMLLKHCTFPRDKGVSVLLFEHITRPCIDLEERFSLHPADPEKVHFTLNLFQDLDHYIEEAWAQLFKPNLPAYAALLEPILTAHISGAHTLGVLGYVRKDIDPFRFHRQSIEPHEQDRFPKLIDVLIDAARDILPHSGQASPHGTSPLITKWFDSEIPMLQRLAVHGFAQQDNVSPDDKIRWLLTKQLLYRFKADVFWFLGKCYPLASGEAKRELLDCAQRGPMDDAITDSDEKIRAYEKFNLINWLSRIAPDCPLTTESLDLVKAQNPDFDPREYPDLEHWTSDALFVDPAEGYDPTSILAASAAAFLDQAPTSDIPTESFDKPRERYCNAISKAVAKRPSWGIEMVEALSSRKLVDADLWSSICHGWRNANLALEDWQSVLDLANVVEAPPAFFEAFTEVLEHGAGREQHAIPAHLMPLSQQVAERIWKLALIKLPREVTSPYGDWLATAINRPGGELARFWLHRVSVARRQAGDSWKVIPQDMSDSLKDMIRGSSGASVHARVVLASQLHYFFSLDSGFAESELLHLFDWQADSERATQCWHGFLIWGRWSSRFTEKLLPHFNETVKHVEQFPERIREALVNHIAGLVLFGIENPLAKGWMTRIVQKLQDSDLEQLAHTIDRSLDRTDSEIAERVWERWLKEYWNLRLLGTPKRLIGKEANKTACWALSVGRYFPEAVSLILKMGDAVSVIDPALFYRIDKKATAKNYPEATADLVLLHLRSAEGSFFADEHVTNVWQDLQHSGIQRDKLIQIREAMFRLDHDPGAP